MSSRIPVIVVSGFLGSGKTTFLKYLIEKTNKKYGLLINEFGDIGIDGDLLKNCSSCNEDFTDAVLSRIQQKELCKKANGTNSATGESTEYSLGC